MPAPPSNRPGGLGDLLYYNVGRAAEALILVLKASESTDMAPAAPAFLIRGSEIWAPNLGPLHYTEEGPILRMPTRVRDHSKGPGLRPFIAGIFGLLCR